MIHQYLIWKLSTFFMLLQWQLGSDSVPTIWSHMIWYFWIFIISYHHIISWFKKGYDIRSRSSKKESDPGYDLIFVRSWPSLRFYNPALKYRTIHRSAHYIRLKKAILQLPGHLSSHQTRLSWSPRCQLSFHISSPMC